MEQSKYYRKEGNKISSLRFPSQRTWKQKNNKNKNKNEKEKKHTHNSFLFAFVEYYEDKSIENKRNKHKINEDKQKWKTNNKKTKLELQSLTTGKQP